MAGSWKMHSSTFLVLLVGYLTTGKVIMVTSCYYHHQCYYLHPLLKYLDINLLLDNRMKKKLQSSWLWILNRERVSIAIL